MKREHVKPGAVLVGRSGSTYRRVCGVSPDGVTARYDETRDSVYHPGMRTRCINQSATVDDLAEWALRLATRAESIAVNDELSIE